jgi:ech hydrogenase subunit D
MSDVQHLIAITADQLLNRAREMRDQGQRLVHIGATPCKELIELNYGFDKEGVYTNLRVTMPSAEASVPSISTIYWCAFLYENEIKELFKVAVDGIAVDFKGSFYKTTIPHPFYGTGASIVKPAPASPATPTATAPATAPALAPSETNPAAH